MIYQLPVNGQPTPPTRKMWPWAVCGIAMAAGFMGLAPILWPALTVAPVIAGGIALAAGIGGYVAGLMQQYKENTTGLKTVPKPTLFNSGLAKGCLLGPVVGAAAGFAVSTLIGGVSLLVFPLMAPAGLAGGAFAGAATCLAVIARNAIARKQEMQQEYEQAVIYSTRPAESYHHSAHLILPEFQQERTPAKENALWVESVSKASAVPISADARLSV